MTVKLPKNRTPSNSGWHICKVCGKSRSIKSVNHEKCLEILAKKAKEKTIKVNIKGRECRFSEEQITSSARRNVAKYKYLNGDLPLWMFD